MSATVVPYAHRVERPEYPLEADQELGIAPLLVVHGEDSRALRNKDMIRVHSGEASFANNACIMTLLVKSVDDEGVSFYVEHLVEHNLAGYVVQRLDHGFDFSRLVFKGQDDAPRVLETV